MDHLKEEEKNDVLNAPAAFAIPQLLLVLAQHTLSISLAKNTKVFMYSIASAYNFNKPFHI